MTNPINDEENTEIINAIQFDTGYVKSLDGPNNATHELYIKPENVVIEPHKPVVKPIYN